MAFQLLISPGPLPLFSIRSDDPDRSKFLARGAKPFDETISPDKYGLEEMANTFVLLIKNVDLQDAGSYKCGNDFMAILVGKWTRTNKHFIRLHHDVQKWVLNWLYLTSILFLFWHEFCNPTPNPNLTLILCVTQTTPLTPSHFPTPLLNLKWHVTFCRQQKKFFKLHLNPTGLTASLWFLNFRLNIRDVLRNRWRNDIYHRWPWM